MKQPSAMWLLSRMGLVLVVGWFVSLFLGPLALLRTALAGLASWNFFGWAPFAGLAVFAWIGDIIIYGLFFLVIWLIARRIFK